MHQVVFAGLTELECRNLVIFSNGFTLAKRFSEPLLYFLIKVNFAAPILK